MAKDLDEPRKKFYFWEMRALNDYKRLSNDAYFVYVYITGYEKTPADKLDVDIDAITDDLGMQPQAVESGLRTLINKGIIDKIEFFNGNDYEIEYRINQKFWDKALAYRDEMPNDPELVEAVTSDD